MKKIIISIFTLIFVLSLVSATSGSIWTTNNDCGNETQNVNQYDIGDVVYINGANFDVGEYSWEIKGQPGKASCDPNEIIASGSFVVGETGAFCFNAYTVQEGDCKEYKVTFDHKHDNYHVVPEFGFFIGGLTLLACIGIFFFIKKQ